MKRMRTGWKLCLWTAVSALAGCGTLDRTSDSQNPVGSIQADAQYLSSSETRDLESSSKIEDPTQLNLAYAKWMEEVGNLIEARKHYTEVAEANRKNSGTVFEAALGLARVDELSGRLAEAEANYLKALKIQPNAPRALNGLGQLQASQQRWPEAIATLTKATEAAPSDNTCRYHLAVALAQSGDVPGAMPHFLRTVGDAEAHYNVGMILKDQGRTAEAERELTIALQKKPDLEQALYWLTKIREDQPPTAGSPVQQTSGSAATPY